jgi:amino acid permease
MKRNVPFLGFVLGLIFPMIGLVIMYFAWFHNGNTFAAYLQTLLRQHDLGAKVLTLSLILNLIPFIFYTSKRLDYTARGILSATILYGVLIILLKFVWS